MKAGKRDGAADKDANSSNGKQASDTSNGIVDSRTNAGLRLLDRAKNGRGEWRNGNSQAKAKDENTRQ